MNDKIKLPTLKKVDPNSPKKPKILLLSDDLRLHSGIATQSKEIVISTLHKYDWVQLGAALKHPEHGKVFDISEDVRKSHGIKDANLKIYAHTGYGNPEVLRELINIEKPDAILHFTDPRFWRWLYEMENEVRQICPIMYYNIWDSIPDPQWNAPFYASCDLLVGISKQTYGINKRVLDKYNMVKEDWAYKYIPHGVSPLFKPLDANDESVVKFKKDLGIQDHDFVAIWNNRNIRRKMPGDLVLSFSNFAKRHPDKKCVLVLHTQPVDDNGTDIAEVVKMIGEYGDYKFTNKKYSTEELNIMYNSADICLNIASNEGFGLASCEAMRAGTPIVVNVTGGLQDQCGFKWNVAPSNMNEQWEYLTADDYKDIGSLHNYRDWEDKVTHGEWVKPVWPRVQTMVGSIPTPYIIDDKVDVYDVADAIKYWYDKTPKERTKAGLQGRKEFLGKMGLNAKNQNKQMADGILKTIENFKPKKKFNVYKLR